MQTDRLKDFLSYDSNTGEFYWLKDTNSRGPSKVGQVAGAVNALGYVQVGIFGCKIYAHKLAWFFTYGYMPAYIDHINGMPWDNRIANLRECSHARNIASIHKGALGYEAHGAKYRARIDVDGVRHELGSFNTPKEATSAYRTARHNLLGDFA